VLDVCTGSGCLAIIAADFFPSAEVVACDLSLEALGLAQDNLNSYDFNDRIQLVQADVYRCILAEQQPLLDQKFDLIIANPPYVPESSMALLPPEFQQEPRMALLADDHGMAIVRKLLAGAPSRLEPNGFLMVEVGHEKAACEALLAAEFPGLFPIWIETEEQVDHVFLCSYSELTQHPWRPPQ
jgi:ribosomal protein L3 glutamine methyltransferase